MTRVRVVAFGGGHGLAASLRALRRTAPDLELDITAVVTVGDDGGSSGRLRAERSALLPPGDLRQALAALAADHDTDPLAGHAVGNLLILGLMEQLGDPVAALDHVARMVHATGRVLPMANHAVGLEAQVRDGDPGRPGEVVTVRGQHAVAVTHGHVEAVRLTPEAPCACPQAVAAVAAADWLIFGPGSWYTSVIPHLLVPELARAIVASPALRLVTLNLGADAETAGLTDADHLTALRRYLPALRVDAVLADSKAVGEPETLREAADALGAHLVLAPVQLADGSCRHDPEALAAALVPVLGADR